MYKFKDRDTWPEDAGQRLPEDPGYERHRVVVIARLPSMSVTQVEVLSISSHPTGFRYNDPRYIPIGFHSSETTKLPLKVGTVKKNHKKRLLKLPLPSWVNLTSKRIVPLTVLKPWYSEEGWGPQYHIAGGETGRLAVEKELWELARRLRAATEEMKLPEPVIAPVMMVVSKSQYI